MVVGRNALVTQGSTTNNALLHELMPSNSLWMHPDAAARLGLSDGMEVRVKSAVGEGTLALKVTEAIREDTVYTDTGFGSISKGLSNVYGNGLAIAAVLESRVDAVTGNAAMHETFVTVTKAGGVS